MLVGMKAMSSITLSPSSSSATAFTQAHTSGRRERGAGFTHTHSAVRRPRSRLYIYTCRTRGRCNTGQSCCTGAAPGHTRRCLHGGGGGGGGRKTSGGTRDNTECTPRGTEVHVKQR